MASAMRALSNLHAVSWDRSGETTLATALLPPTEACVEAGDTADIEHLKPVYDEMLRALQMDKADPGPLLFVSLRTDTALGQHLGLVIGAALAVRLDFEADLATRVDTVLVEAISNGLIHGNLELNSAGRSSLAELASYGRDLEERSARADLAARRIWVLAGWSHELLRILVKDDGVSSQRPPQAAAHPLDTAKQGRGLAICAALADTFFFDETRKYLRVEFHRLPSTTQSDMAGT